MIYHKSLISLPIIPKEKIKNLLSYRMVEELEKKGYEVYIKDCTLNGIFPVLGVLVLNRARTKYFFKLGSDINIDICLQRCITEMFQGLDLNTTFRFEMNETDSLDYEEFWNLEDTENEYYKTVRVGSGKIPRNIFVNNITNNLNLQPFINGKLDNEEVCKILLAIVKKSGRKIFVKDYSILGFPTLSIFIPGMSDIIGYNNGIYETQHIWKN